MEDEAKDLNPTPNNFTYEDDADGLKCPFHAHIRKINPRDPSAEQRTHLMPRRGIPFGDPDRDFKDESTFPPGGVGLLFMAYNQDIGRQFEVSQHFWANNVTFPGERATGRDPIIGQAPQGGVVEPTWHPQYGVAGGEKPFGFEGFVTMKGGEYFFAPSRGFLKQLV